jgi:tetratricopeptide (TPR) repeat protein
VQTAIDLSLLLGHLHHYKDARRLLQRAAAVAGPWPELKRAAHTAEAEIAIQLGEFKIALKALADVQRLSAGDAFEQHRVLVATAQALGGAGEHERALSALDQAATLIGEEDPVLRFERTKVRALILGFRGDWQGCAEASADAAEQGQSVGLEYEVAVNLHNEGDALLRGGDLPRAYASLQASLSVAEQIGSDRLVNLDRMLLAYLDALKGSEPAARTLGEGLAHAELRKWTWDVLTGRYLLGKLLVERGDAAGAQRELELARQMALGAGNQLIAEDCRRELAQIGK